MLSQPVITCSKLTIETLEQRCEICSKLTVKTPKRRQWGHTFVGRLFGVSHFCSSISIVDFEHVNAGWIGLGSNSD